MGCQVVDVFIADGFNARTPQKVVEALDCTLDHNGAHNWIPLFHVDFFQPRDALIHIVENGLGVVDEHPGRVQPTAMDLVMTLQGLEALFQLSESLMHLKVESSGTAYPQGWLTGAFVELAQPIS